VIANPHDEANANLRVVDREQFDQDLEDVVGFCDECGADIYVYDDNGLCEECEWEGFENGCDACNYGDCCGECKCC
jgi:hypothetical protein